MRIVLGAALLVVLMASSAVAQVERGDREIQGSGHLFVMSDAAMLNLSGVFGYYYTASLELGGGPTITYSRAGDVNNTTVGLTLFTKYNFATRDKLVPYVGGQLYQYDLSPQDPLKFTDVTFLQGCAGFKYFIRKDIAYDASANLGFSPGGDVSFFLTVGVSAVF